MAQRGGYNKNPSRIQLTRPARRRKKNGTGSAERITWDYVWRIGLGVLGYNKSELGLMTMRHFVNASEGYAMKTRGEWEQARLIAYYSAMPHMKKGFRITDIPIPNESDTSNTESQVNKQEVYKLLEKWNK